MRKSRRQIQQEWANAKKAAREVSVAPLEEPTPVKPIHSFEKEEIIIDESYLEEDAKELEYKEKSTRTRKARNASSDEPKPKKVRKIFGKKPKKNKK